MNTTWSVHSDSWHARSSSVKVAILIKMNNSWCGNIDGGEKATILDIKYFDISCITWSIQPSIRSNCKTSNGMTTNNECNGWNTCNGALNYRSHQHIYMLTKMLNHELNTPLHIVNTQHDVIKRVLSTFTQSCYPHQE